MTAAAVAVSSGGADRLLTAASSPGWRSAGPAKPHTTWVRLPTTGEGGATEFVRLELHCGTGDARRFPKAVEIWAGRTKDELLPVRPSFGPDRPRHRVAPCAVRRRRAHGGALAAAGRGPGAAARRVGAPAAALRLLDAGATLDAGMVAGMLRR